MTGLNNLKLTVKILGSMAISCILGIFIGYKMTDLNSSVNNISLVSIFIAVLLLIVVARIMVEGILKPTKNISFILGRLCDGDVNYTINAARGDEIGEIEKSLLVLRQNILSLVSQMSDTSISMQNGDLDSKIDESKLNGAWKNIADAFNKSNSTIISVIKEAQHVMGKLAVNDYTLNMNGKYNGDLRQFSDDINAVHARLLSVQDAFIRVSKGDTSRLEEFRKVVRRSENDKLIPAMIAMNEAIENVIKETELVTKAVMEGNLQTRADLERFEGGYRKIVDELNRTIDVIQEPLEASLKVLGRLAVNDFSTRMDGKYKGVFNDFANGINDVQNHMIHVQEIAKHIAEGDVSELEDLKRTGRRSENDHLIPSFISMMETINELINEAALLTRAAVEGRLNARGDAGKFRGGYMEIIQGLNKTLDAVIEPIKEASVVLSEVAKGNLQVSVTGDYKGDHAEIKNALNSTIGILRGYILEISKVLNEISEGNLEVNISGDYKGDFIDIKDSLNQIIKSLNEVMTEINAASGQVASGSKQVSISSQALSQGATEQASSIEEITATITQIATQTKQNALNAHQANELGIGARDVATQGNDQMKNMLSAMAEVNESSTNISKIIKVIDDIAFQTNILALNAAVEAARAGQYGKGFAVVAEEVRNLAARSANAAKETTALIEGSIRKVEAGTKLANETADALKRIVDGVTKVSNLVGDIANASNEQATGITQVNQAIAQVSDVVQTNSATSEESAAASQELSSQAEFLKNMVGRFKLKQLDTSFGSARSLSQAGAYSLESMGDMRKRNNADSGEDLGKEVSAAVGKASSSKMRIALSDNEFGKY